MLKRNPPGDATVVRQEAEPAATGELSDALLVEHVRHGERTAYGELVRRYEKKLLRTLYRMVGRAETAEDLPSG